MCHSTIVCHDALLFLRSHNQNILLIWCQVCMQLLHCSISKSVIYLEMGTHYIQTSAVTVLSTLESVFVLNASYFWNIPFYLNQRRWRCGCFSGVVLSLLPSSKVLNISSPLSVAPDEQLTEAGMIIVFNAWDVAIYLRLSAFRKVLPITRCFLRLEVFKY